MSSYEPEQAAAQATVAMAADLEYLVNARANPDGMVPALEIIRALDAYRDAAGELTP